MLHKHPSSALGAGYCRPFNCFHFGSNSGTEQSTATAPSSRPPPRHYMVGGVLPMLAMDREHLRGRAPASRRGVALLVGGRSSNLVAILTTMRCGCIDRYMRV
jgi:hypothetical protein